MVLIQPRRCNNYMILYSFESSQKVPTDRLNDSHNKQQYILSNAAGFRFNSNDNPNTCIRRSTTSTQFNFIFAVFAKFCGKQHLEQHFLNNFPTFDTRGLPLASARVEICKCHANVANVFKICKCHNTMPLAKIHLHFAMIHCVVFSNIYSIPILSYSCPLLCDA